MVLIREFLNAKKFTANHLPPFILRYYKNHKWKELSIFQRLSNSAQKSSQRGWFTLYKLKMCNLACCESFCIQKLAYNNHKPSLPHPIQHINVYVYRTSSTRKVLFLKQGSLIYCLPSAIFMQPCFI